MDEVLRALVISAATALAAMLCRWLYRTAKEIQTTWIQLIKDVHTIKNEATYNGGSSMKDKIEGLTTKLNVLATEVRRVFYEVKIGTAARRLSDTKAICEVMIDTAGNAVTKYVSYEWTEITGLSREDMDDGGWAQCIHVDHRHRIILAAQQAAERKTLFIEEYPIVNVRTDAEYYVRHTGYPIMTDFGVLIGWVGDLIKLEDAVDEL